MVAESSPGTGYELGGGVFKNNGVTQFQNLHFHRRLSGGGSDTGSIGMEGLISLTSGDTLEVWLWNETNTTSVVVDDITLNLVMIGG